MGQREAELREVFERSYQKAYRAAKTILLDRQAAEDAVSEALVRLWRALGGARIRTDADRYFIRIAVNEAKRIWTRRKETAMENIWDYTAKTVDPAERQEERERAAALLAAVERLGEKLALPLKLRYYGGFSVEETAEMLHISCGAAKTRLSRARQKLKETLEAEDFLEESKDEM